MELVINIQPSTLGSCIELLVSAALLASINTLMVKVKTKAIVTDFGHSRATVLLKDNLLFRYTRVAVVMINFLRMRINIINI